MPDRNDKIFVAGHNGMVGSAICRALMRRGSTNIVTRTRAELDLLDQREVRGFFEKERPDHVYLAAALVGGIMANMTRQADFLYENAQVQSNVIWQAHLSGVKKLMFLGSSCIYPRGCPQPMKEEYLLDGKPEPTNEGYAIAKIAGLKLCEKLNEQYGRKFISCMPTNLYGPGDNFGLESSHVLPALIRKFHDAKVSGMPSVTLWGDGSARREFLHVDDLAEATVFLMDKYDGPSFVNIGSGEDITIRNLAEKIRGVVGYEGDIVFDATKPNGMPKKLLDVSKLHGLGWTHRISLDEGLESTYAWFMEAIITGNVRGYERPHVNA